MNKFYSRLLILMALAGITPPITTAASKPVAAVNTTTNTTGVEKRPVYQDTDPKGSNYLSRQRALVGSHCMVNRLSPTLAKVISVNANYQNLVNTDLTDCVTMTSTAKVSVGTEPFVTVRDMAHYYAAGTTAGFVMQVDANKVLGLKLGGLPFKIFFYYKGEVQDSAICDQKNGTVLALDLIHVSGDNATVEITAKSTKPFDEIGIRAEGVASIDVLGSTSIYYAFVGKNGKYYLTSSAYKSSDDNALNGYLYGSEHDTSTGGIGAFTKATGFSSNITLGQWPAGWPHKHVAMIDEETSKYDVIAVSGERDVFAIAADGSMPFKAGMRAGVEIEKIEVLKALTVSGVHLYQYRPNGSSSDDSDTDGSKGHESTWTDVTPTQAKNFQFLSVNLGFSKQEMSVTATQDFNAIGIKNVGVDLGAINAYRAFVELPPEVIDDDEPLVISADRSLCDEKQSVTLHSDVPVTWSCDDAHGSTLSFAYNTSAPDTLCTVSGLSRAGKYVFKATDANGRTATTTVKYGISREYDLAMKPWVNNFTEKDENGKQIHYSSDMDEYRKKNKIVSGDLLPLGGTTDIANIVTPSLDDYATYIGGVQLANDKMVTGVYRDHPVTLKKKTIVGFVTKAKWTAADVNLLNGLSVKLYNAGNELTNVSKANNNFKLLSATVIGSNSEAETQYTVEVDASESNTVTFDAITLWNQGLLSVNISGIDIIDAFTETAEDAENYQKKLDESGEMVSHYTTGARIDESLMNGGSGVEVAQVCNNLANIVDGKTDTYMNFVAPVTAAKFVPIPIKLGRRYDAGHQVKLIYSTNKALGVHVAQAINLVTYLKGKKQETKDNFKIVDANVVGGSDKSEIVWTPTKDFDEISIHLAGVADVAENYKIYGIRIENDADRDGIPDDEDDQSCDNPFLIDEYETETSLKKSHDYVNGRMNLRRYMKPERTDKTTHKLSQWFNICLPVNLSFNQFVSTFGNNAELAKPDNFEEKYPKYLHFNIPYVYGNNTLLEAGVPYIIKIDTLNLVDVDKALSDELKNNDASAQTQVYKVQGVDFPMDGSGREPQNILCKQQNTTTKAGNVTWQGGYYKNQHIEKGFYMFNQGVLRYIAADVDQVLGLRSWMREIDGTSEAKFSGMDINGTLFGNTTTGINQVNAGEKDNRMFNLQGMRVDNADGKLPEGIYIINGKKVIIK